VLVQLAIRDLVLIEQVDLALGPGLTVLTGETGAGKSILLDGLGLALGDRADPALVRAGAIQASVSATFVVPPGHAARAFLAAEDLPAPEDDELLLRRTLKADGGSRAWIGGEPVAAGTLRALGQLLVEIHGQHDERGLLNPRGHLALLDAFAGHGPLLTLMAEAHAARASAEAALAEAQAAEAEADADRDWLNHAVGELAALDPRPGEEQALADARAAMKKGQALAEGLAGVETLISATNGALSQLRQAARRLERMEDPDLAAALQAVDRALVEGDSIEAALAAARRRLLVSPEELEAAEARLFDLRAIARKHRVAVDDLPALAQTLAARLAAITTAGERTAALESAAHAARAAEAQAGAALTAARRTAAARLDSAVNAELPALKLGSARFRTAIDPAEPGPLGADRVQFEVATNAATTFGPLTRIASGGELSRFVLALKVALAATGTAGTLVFDEIDRGVGGATASAIGERLARVAGSAQLLVVTHSPQVAAAGHAHARIAKDGGRTSVTRLSAEARLEEVARMLSGAEITAEARAQAARLLAA
jgi:DNA repair protein RecN (Recombination protein N)